MNEILRDSTRNIANCTKAIPAANSVELSEMDILDGKLSEEINSEWLQPLIDGKLSPQEIINKKTIIAKAIIKGIKEGVIAPMTAEEIAALIDEGFTRLIVAQQVAQGAMDTIEAVDVLADHAASRVVTIVDAVITKIEIVALEGADIISDTLVNTAAMGLKVVASAFPPTRMLVPFVDTVAQFIKPVARIIVKKGIKMVANAARTIVKNAVPIIFDKVNQAGRAVKSFFKSLF